MKERLACVLSVLAILAAFWGGYSYIETHYCGAAEFQLFAQATQYKFRSMEIREINSRIWQLEERLRHNPLDKTAEEELRRLKEEKRIAEVELQELSKAKK